MSGQTAWAYLVVSSSQQAETLDDQVAWAERTAKENNWRITRQFKNASSGALGTRELFEELLAELKATPKSQRPDRVLMIRLDRLGRGLALEPLAALAQIYRLGVIVHDRQDGDVQITRAADTIKPILRVLTGALENEARSDKAKTSHAKRRANGQHAGNPPYGVILDERGMPVADEPRASVVRRAFEMRLTGAGYESIAHAVGPTAPQKILKNGRPKQMGWHRTFVRTLLRCETYRDVVVPSDLFSRVQQVRNPDFKQRAQRRWDWPLSGVLKCVCGYAFTGSASGGNCARCKGGARRHNHQRIRYYVCNARNAHVGVGGRRNVRADSIEKQFENLLRRLAASPELVEAFAHRRADIDVVEMQRHLRSLESSIPRLDRNRSAAWDAQAEGAISATELNLRLAGLRAEQEQTEAQIADLGHAIARASAEAQLRPGAARLFERAAETWRSACVRDKKRIAALVATIVGGLGVDEEGVLLYGRDASKVKVAEQMREVNTLRDVQMAQRKADDGITKKFIESITE